KPKTMAMTARSTRFNVLQARPHRGLFRGGLGTAAVSCGRKSRPASETGALGAGHRPEKERRQYVDIPAWGLLPFAWLSITGGSSAVIPAQVSSELPGHRAAAG